MNRALVAGVAVALAACDGKPEAAATSEPSDAATATAAPTPSASSDRQIGTTSGLTGQVSGLTGAVSDFVVQTTDTETIVALAADTLFEFDKADIQPAAEENLKRTADLIGKGGAGPVRIVGHTDAKGDDAYNDALSRRRAEAVAAWLRSKPAMRGRQLTVEGMGERDPVAPNAKPDGSDDAQGRARNRRVEVRIPR